MPSRQDVSLVSYGFRDIMHSDRPFLRDCLALLLAVLLVLPAAIHAATPTPTAKRPSAGVTPAAKRPATPATPATGSIPLGTAFTSTCGQPATPCCFCSSSVGRLDGVCASTGTLCWTDVGGTVLGGSRVSGHGTLLAFGQRISMTYTFTASDGRFIGNGTWRGEEESWLALPGVPGVEVKLTAPAIQVQVGNNPASLASSLSFGGLALRSSARKPDGTPWSQVERAAPTTLPIDAAGRVVLSLPTLPVPQVEARQDVPWCNAACGALGSISLPGSTQRFDGQVAVPSGTAFPAIRLQYREDDREQCSLQRWEVTVEDVWENVTNALGVVIGRHPSQRTRSEWRQTDECRRDTLCLPGFSRVADNGAWICRTPGAPALPTLPRSVTVAVAELFR